MVYPNKAARLVILATLSLSTFPLLVSCRVSPESPAPLLEGMALVPGGWFKMGSEDGPASSRPRHDVYLDPFAIDICEVTEAHYAGYLRASGDRPEAAEAQARENQDTQPAVGVLWLEADSYCRWVGKRLPTEAEWEKAARGTDGRRFPWGDAWDLKLANSAETGSGKPMPVGSFPGGASPYGVLDMAGNAAEWVADYFDPAYYTFSPDTNPLGPFTVLDHVLRGGSWDSPPEQLQTFFRDSSHSARPNPRVGFRCAITLPEASTGTPSPLSSSP